MNQPIRKLPKNTHLKYATCFKCPETQKQEGRILLTWKNIVARKRTLTGYLKMPKEEPFQNQTLTQPGRRAGPPNAFRVSPGFQCHALSETSVTKFILNPHTVLKRSSERLCPPEITVAQPPPPPPPKLPSHVISSYSQLIWLSDFTPYMAFLVPKEPRAQSAAHVGMAGSSTTAHSLSLIITITSTSFTTSNQLKSLFCSKNFPRKENHQPCYHTLLTWSHSYPGKRTAREKESEGCERTLMQEQPSVGQRQDSLT